MAERRAPQRAAPPPPPPTSSSDHAELHPEALAEREAEIAAIAADVAHGSAVAPVDPYAEARRMQRLAEGVRGLRTGGGTLRIGERILMILGGILAPLGLVLVLIGWNGAAHSPNLFEQIPYAISGGLFGLGLCFLGSFLYFAHWMTELVREQRVQSSAVVEAITRLEDAIAAAAVTSSSPNGSEPTTELVATARGSMAHRADCVVVSGKPGLRAVTVTDGLAPCKLCDPYAAATN